MSVLMSVINHVPGKWWTQVHHENRTMDFWTDSDIPPIIPTYPIDTVGTELVADAEFDVEVKLKKKWG